MGFSADLTCRLIKSSLAKVSLKVRKRPFTQTYLLEKGLDNKIVVHLTGNKVVKDLLLHGTNDVTGNLFYPLRWMSPFSIKESLAPLEDWSYPSVDPST